MSPVIYVDLRCLQDPCFQRRGIGQHVASILRSRPENGHSAWTLVGVTDDSLGDLPTEYIGLADEITPVSNVPISQSGAIFVDCSPMTHDPWFSLRFTANSGFLKAAIIYDFIPFDRPGYLPTQIARIEYLAKLARLRNFNFYLPISNYSARRLSEILGVSRRNVAVTGASVRNSLYGAHYAGQFAPSPYDRPEPYFLSVGGGDRRKNTEAAVAGVRRLNEAQSKKLVLKVVGNYEPNYKSDLLSLAGHMEGKGFLEFLSNVEDDILADLYSGSIATIVPSYIEGFSLPVVEAPVCGAPVIASACDAHKELITQTEATFVPDNHQDLADKLRRILQDRGWRSQLLIAQARVAEDFSESRVGARFWNSLAERFAVFGRVHVLKLKKPKVALLSPYPPDQSGVARYSQLTIEAASQSLDIDLYTNAPRPLAVQCFRDAGAIGKAAVFNRNYDAVISVLGNSHFHIPIFEVFERFGGPCILHDSRLTQIYYLRLGPERFLEFAAAVLGRRVTLAEVELWLQDRDLPSLFVEPILKRTRPLIVHTKQYQTLLYERYGVRAEVTTCCPNMQFSDEELSNASRTRARQSLGISPETFLISSFGFVGKAKGLEACIIATELLRGWNVPAELHFVGSPLMEEPELVRIADECGVSEQIHWMKTFVDERTYRKFFLASDAAVQLRSYGLGQYSAALGDCISAALPCVATRELAASCEAPDYVHTIPGHNYPLQLAEQLATVWERGRRAGSRMEARNEYLAGHNFAFYVKRLREILDLA
jgi:glycosyltransferase involved in cell wall biosynthesis